MSQSGDPRELARKLAEEAKAKALAKKAAEEAEAQARKAAEEAEAQAKHAAALQALPESQPEVEDPKALARRLVEEAKARVAAAHANPHTLHHTAPPIHPPPPAPPPAPVRKLSALEAMRQAIEDEKAAAAVPAPAPLPSKPRELIALKLPGCVVVSTTPVTQRDTFRALWTAHRIRAVADADARLIVTADALLDAAARLPAGAMLGAHVRYGGHDHALFVDTAHGVLLGLTDRPELYLAGL